MSDFSTVFSFEENARKRLSEFFFGKGSDYSWVVITGHYLSLEAALESTYDWVRDPASDTLAYIDPDDEKILKRWIADHPPSS